MDQNYGPNALARRPVEPTLHFQPVNGPPAEVCGRDESWQVCGHALGQIRDAGWSSVSFAVTHEVNGMTGIIVGADPASITYRCQWYEVAVGVLQRGLGANLYVEQRCSRSRLLDPDYDDWSSVRGSESLLDAAAGIVHEPAYRSLVPYAQFAVGPRLHHEEDPTAVVEPGRRDLDRGAEIQDLTVFIAFYGHQPGLLPGGVQIVARIQHVGARTVQLGQGNVSLLERGENLSLARPQVVPVEPVGLRLFSALCVQVCGVDEPASIRVQLAAPDVVVRVRLRQRLHRPWLGEPYAEEANALVAVVILQDEHGFPVRGPRDDLSISFGRLREAEGSPRAVRGRGEDVGGGPEARPAPGDPRAVGRDHRPEERGDREQGVETAVLLQGDRR